MAKFYTHCEQCGTENLIWRNGKVIGRGSYSPRCSDCEASNKKAQEGFCRDCGKELRNGGHFRCAECKYLAS